MNKRNLLFIEITAYEIRFLKIKQHLGSKLPSLAFQSIPLLSDNNPSPEEGYSGILQVSPARLGQVLREYRQNVVGNQKISAYLLLPFEKGLMREYKLPWIKKRDRASAIEYCLKHEMPYLVDELVFKYRVIEERVGQDLRIQVTACRRDVVKFYTQCFAKAGYVLKSIEYSAWALGEFLNVPDSATLLCLRKANLNEAELILYQGTVPLAIREIRIRQGKYSAPNVFFNPQDLGVPVDFLLTDGSYESKEAANLLKDLGLIGQAKIFTPATAPMEELFLEGLATYTLLGARQRVQAQKNYNFIAENNSKRFKIITLMAAACLILLLSAAGRVLLGQYSDYHELQADITHLSELCEQQEDHNNYAQLEEWNKIKATSLKDLQRIHHVMGETADIKGQLTVTRWNYQPGKLIIYARCSHNDEIMLLMNKLALSGWEKPVLESYHGQKGSIAFTLSILSK
ncbi:MAG: hypothetical protein GX207_04320 [Peptococcaceae bacterium]|nr:hypothetical protein [Peptococcaceae bacterium]